MQPPILPGQTRFYRGKVRDVYTINNRWVILHASNRLSAFDVILPRPIPFKGQVLNQLAAYMLNAVRHICPVWLTNVPAPSISVGHLCEPIKIEMVVRGYLTGHAWRTYQNGLRELCGISLPEGMKENEPFKTPIITPSTKAEEGHDEDISADKIISGGLATAKIWEELSAYALRLFEHGGKMAQEKGLILVDTKYEFGIFNNQIMLMDEIHTPDSSRYFFADGFEERLRRNEKQPQLSKEFVREWLIENNFMGKPGQQIPEMDDNRTEMISKRYIELFEKLTGRKFAPLDLTEDKINRILITTAEELLNK